MPIWVRLYRAVSHSTWMVRRARTTVRDIVAASGTDPAAINYHFGTRDKLLNQAMMESSADAVQQILESPPAHDAEDPAARLRQLITSFTENRARWTADSEGLTQALHSPELRTEFGTAQAQARDGLSDFSGLVRRTRTSAPSCKP